MTNLQINDELEVPLIEEDELKKEQYSLKKVRKHVRKKLQEKRMTKIELADILGYSLPMVSLWLNGKTDSPFFTKRAQLWLEDQPVTPPDKDDTIKDMELIVKQFEKLLVSHNTEKKERKKALKREQEYKKILNVAEDSKLCKMSNFIVGKISKFAFCLQLEDVQTENKKKFKCISLLLW